MGKLIVSSWTSLDGYIAGPSGEMDWILGDEELGAYELDLVGHASTMIFGGKTYREFSAFWPNVRENPDANPFEKAFAALINPLPKVVFSRRLEEPLWDGTTIHREIHATEIRRLKESGDGHLLIYGSASIVAQLTRDRLIDEYHVLVHPLLLGSGLGYFPKSETRVPLKRIGCRPLQSGVSILIFAPSS